LQGTELEGAGKKSESGLELALNLWRQIEVVLENNRQLAERAEILETERSCSAEKFDDVRKQCQQRENDLRLMSEKYKKLKAQAKKYKVVCFR